MEGDPHLGQMSRESVNMQIMDPGALAPCVLSREEREPNKPARYIRDLHVHIMYYVVDSQIALGRHHIPVSSPLASFFALEPKLPVQGD